MGRSLLATFEAAAYATIIAITGRHDADLDRLCADLRTTVRIAYRPVWRPAPVDRYVFLITAWGRLRRVGHRASTALLCSRDDLPQAAMREANTELPHFSWAVQP
jgi:predicted metalloprotease with PDZ domain